MAFGDIPEDPSWAIDYRVRVFQKCTFCGDNGCNFCKPKVRDGKGAEELLDEAEEVVGAYCGLREHQNVWRQLGDMERMLIVYAIDYGRQHSGEEYTGCVEPIDRFKELDFR